MSQKKIDFQWCDQQRILRDCELPIVKSADGVSIRPLTLKAMLNAIASHRPRCWASVATLSREAGGMSPRHAKRAVAALKLLGLLATEKRPGRSDEHSVVWSELSLLCRSGALEGTGALGAPTGALGAPTGALEGTRGLSKSWGGFDIDHSFLSLRESARDSILKSLAVEESDLDKDTANFVRVVSGMRAANKLSEHDLASALNGLRVSSKPIGNRVGYLRRTLQESFKQGGLNFEAELSSFLGIAANV